MPVSKRLHYHGCKRSEDFISEQLEKIVDKVLKGNEDDRYIVVKGFYPNGRTKVYAIDLAE